MIVLTLLHPQTHQPLEQWSFTDPSVIRIGRLQDNDIVLEQFLQVSRHHLELQRVDDPSTPARWRLVSQGTNGTFLNGVLVNQVFLNNDDLVQLAPEGPLLQFQTQTFQPSFPTISAESCTHAGNPSTNLFCIHCGQPLVEKEQFIHHYQILRILGRGGMGTTYLAWNISKIMGEKPSLLVLKEMNANLAKVAKARELFEREARILKSLNHPGIPKYYDFFVEHGKKYLAMELIHGQNLEQHIERQGPISLKQAIEWMIQICDILQYLHSLTPPLVHRDVKPANLILRNLDCRVMLLDFGAVKEIGTPPGTRIGAEGYSAPEQSRGKTCPQSDLYAIGPTLIFLLTGENPMKYYCRWGNELNFDVSHLSAISLSLGKTIKKICQPKWRDRYQTAQELAQVLATLRP
jgi:serine/threonine-protein kinase